MPKLRERRMDENRQLIEQAALQLFTRRGFNGTNIREIADAAGVSTGAIYTYYPSKVALFTSVVHSREAAISGARAQMFGDLEKPLSQKGLMRLAESLRRMIYENSDYWRLMYIDVVEFDNRHFAESFHDLPEQFRQRLGEALGAVKKEHGWCGEDPGFAYASIYLHLVTYFLVEKLFCGNQHMGVPDEEAMRRTVQLLCYGLWGGKPAADAPADTKAKNARTNKPRTAPQPSHAAAAPPKEIKRKVRGKER
jgi:AcrR family transcriptional regulator